MLQPAGREEQPVPATLCFSLRIFSANSAVEGFTGEFVETTPRTERHLLNQRVIEFQK